jgi:hypothetical protein
MMNRTSKSASWAAAFLSLASLATPIVSKGADHRDSPRLMANTTTEGNIDINDIYIFQSPTTKANTVIIMTLSPAAGVIGPSTFRQYCSYEIRVQNTAALADNLVFQFTFSAPDAYGRQNFQLLKQYVPGKPLITQTSIAPLNAVVEEPLAFGPTGQQLAVKGGGKVMAGLFDDPFFFDLNAFNQFVALAEAGAPLAQRVAPFLPPNIPNDFFGNFNVIAVVLEVPTASLLSNKNDPKLAIWARTLGINEQVDRMGRPAITTATIPTVFKDVYNTLTPFTDTFFFTGYQVGEIANFYGVTTAYAQMLSSVLLPDLLTIDTSKPSGFLNGRLLTDDVIDAEFKLLTNGALTSDRVDNDSVFSNSFPYLGAAQPRSPLK